MKLIPYDAEKIRPEMYKKSKNLLILEEFQNSGLECARVEGFTQANAGYCASSLNLSIKHYKIYNIRAISRKGKVYLIKESNT